MPPAQAAPNQKTLEARHQAWEKASTHRQRRALFGASLAIIALMLCAIGAFLRHDYLRSLDAAGESALRRSQRLVQDMEQTLTVARTVISQSENQLLPTPVSRQSDPGLSASSAYAGLLASLQLPFDLHALGAAGESKAIIGMLGHAPIGVHHHLHDSNGPLTPDQWTLGKASADWQGRIIPLTWKAATNDQGIEGYAVDLSYAAVAKWLERERVEPDDRVSLFWLNSDGTASLMARAPDNADNIARRVHAPWVDAALQSPSGTLDQLSALDGMPRRVAFQRLSGPAAAMVVVYGAGTQMALAPWRARLPYFLLAALLLGTAMAYGAWRLDRTLRALAQSERHFQLVLDSGNVWDWDIASGKVRYASNFLTNLGYPELPQDRMTALLAQIIDPEDVTALLAAVKAHLKRKAPYALEFRIKDAQGNTRWFHTKGQAFWDTNDRAQYMAGIIFEITERVQLATAQRETLQRLDLMANASPVMLWTAKLNGDLDWVNRRGLEFTGRRLEQDLGQGWMESVHPDDAGRAQAFFEASLASEQPVSTEYRFRHHDGGYRRVIAQCMPMRDDEHNPIGFIGSCIDVSALRQAEEAARERGAMLEATFQVLPDLLFVIDQSGRFIHFQGSAQDRLYVPPDTFLGKLVCEVMPPNIASLLERHLQLARGGTLQEFAYSLCLPGGEHHFEARMARLPESDRYMVVARDITEREHLRQFTTLQARLATEFINLPVSQIDQGINQALAEIGAFAQTDRAYIFEYDFANLRTSNTHEWCAPNTRAELGRLQNIPLSMVPDWVETHAQRQRIDIPDVPAMPPGPLRDLLMDQSIRSLITLPMCNAEGCIGFVGFDSVHSHHRYNEEQIGLLKQFAQMLVNVYDRKAAAASLQQLNAELEQRVQQRTRELDVSVQRLSHANRELESFAYSVSHDLKAPLRSVEGFASLLLDEHSASLNDEARDYLGRIQRATLHMARLISDLLGYCRMEEMDKKIEPVQLLGVVNEVIGGMRNELDARGVKMQVNVPAGVTALAHPQGLAMALRNLIDNAIKFTPPGTAPDITLSASSANGRTRLCVKDQGQGFDMRYHDRIFAIFQRLHRPEAIPGTGIGLAMVAKAVQRMNGRIWADSKPGEGAKFHIELPSA
jgi:PAS domain S-box-containing protein